MDKEEALSDFLKGLRVALNNASAYSKDHPYFVKSIQEFKKKLDTLLTYLDPVKINIAEESLFIDGRRWEKMSLYAGLASHFHLRKIKSIELLSGLTIEELVDFLSGLALPPREIIKSGGFGVILAKARSRHCRVEELDYSSLLEGSGEETGDVWAYIFGEAVSRQDPEKLEEFTENFEPLLHKIKAQDFFDNDDLRQSLHDFLAYLKENRKEEYTRCTKDLLAMVLNYREKVSAEQLDKVRVFFRDLDENDFAQLLWEKFLKDDSFDAVSYQLFSRLSGEERHKKISESLLKKTGQGKPYQVGHKAFKKMQELLLSADSQVISEGYRTILLSLSKGTAFSKELAFDRKVLKVNYRYMLLNLLDQENQAEKLKLIAGRIAGEWEKVEEEQDSRFARYLLDVILMKSEPDLAGLFDRLNSLILSLALRLIFETGLSEDAEYLLEHLDKSALNPQEFVDKIFQNNTINLAGLKVLLKFLPEGLEPLYDLVERKRSDIEFLSELMAALKNCESSEAKKVLKQIFSLSNEFVRVEALGALRDLGGADPGFILSVIVKASPLIRKAALLALEKSESSRREAVNLLLDIPSPFGRKNKLIMENLNIADETDLREAKEAIEHLSRRPFFWNRQIRIRARQILAKWYAGKS